MRMMVVMMQMRIVVIKVIGEVIEEHFGVGVDAVLAVVGGEVGMVIVLMIVIEMVGWLWWAWWARIAAIEV